MRTLPWDSRSKVAVMRAASVGDMTPGRTATRNLSRFVLGTNVDATTHASSQEFPVGNSTAP
jgi:hypothetical protein